MHARPAAGLFTACLGILFSYASIADSYTVYVGTYTGGGSRGIYAFELDRETGSATVPRLVAETPNPSFLAVHPNERFLYAVNETDEFNGQSGGGLSAFRIDDAELTPLNGKSTRGGAPCHLFLDRRGRSVLVANYTGGSVISYRLNHDGSLGDPGSFIQHTGSSVDARRQTAPHAHGIYLNRRENLALVPDLGLDQVLVYQFDSKSADLRPNRLPFVRVAPGSGPRHLAIHPSQKFVFVLNELSSTITTFAFDSRTGGMSELGTISTLPEGFTEANSTAEIFVHPRGRFLYSSNRGHDSIAVFGINPDNGDLNPIDHEPTGGKTPRSFNLDPSGQWLLAANQNSGNLSVFRVNANDGTLRDTGQSVDVPRPVCVVFTNAK